MSVIATTTTSMPTNTNILGRPIYSAELLDWIPKENLDWNELCENTSAIALLTQEWDNIQDKIDYCYLCGNSKAVPLLEQHWDSILYRIKWNWLCANPDAVHLIKKNWPIIEYFGRVQNPKKRKYSENKQSAYTNLNSTHVWAGLCSNPNKYIGQLVEKNWQHIMNLQDIDPDSAFTNECFNSQSLWSNLCANPSLVYLIDLHWGEIQENIWWSDLCRNESAIPLLEKHWDTILDKIDWFELCANSSAIPLLQKHWDTIQDKIDWCGICENPSAISFIKQNWDNLQTTEYISYLCTNINAFPLLEKHWDEIFPKMDAGCWGWLCYYPFAVPFLEKHLNTIRDFIDWGMLSSNRGIFKLDLAAMREQARPFAEELAAKVFHPKRVAAWEAAGLDVAEEM